MRLPALLLGCCLFLAAGQGFEEARKFYDLTDFEKSLQVLAAIPDKDAADYELMGRDYYMLADYRKATECLEKAMAAGPENAEVALWLGRAYGRRAETSSPFTAPGQASKARQFFEKSVALDPTNAEALSDLFDYYLDAPGFLGGGLDKAQALIPKISAVDVAEGDSAQARLAEKRKEFGSAEQYLREAIDASPQRIGRLLELARFLARQGRFVEADQNIARAERMAPNSPRVIYTRADIYIQNGRHLDVARKLLKKYMSMTLSPDDPPRSDAAKLLKKVQGG